MAPQAPSFAAWETFWVIVGSSAAALTGLMFVVITLISASRTATHPEGFKGFGSPTVIHFTAVLILAALFSIPGHTFRTLALCGAAVAIGGLLLVGDSVIHIRRQTMYKVLAVDWFWFVVLPLVGYLVLFGGAAALWQRAPHGLHVVACAALFILVIGLHNAWDTATWTAIQPPPS